MALGANAFDVFINCPFDPGYDSIFQALVFAIHDARFVARSAKEESDGSELRLEKIFRLIADCPYGIHDLSRTEMDAESGLPRFNMPLELGIFLGCKRFGGAKQKAKRCLVLDADRFRYMKFISDINGQDISAHKNDPRVAQKKVNEWLRTASRRHDIPGPEKTWERYEAFRRELPAICEKFGKKPDGLLFVDLSPVISVWLDANLD